MKEEAVQELIREVLTGLKNKMLQPIKDENKELALAIQSLQEKITCLEQKIEESPVVMLAALRDAINNVKGGEHDDPAS
ncbi:MAG: hypothetical protein AB1556_01480 [Bacillota bacterium]